MTRLSRGRHGYFVDMADIEMELGRRLHGQVRNEVSLVFLPIVQLLSGGIIEEIKKNVKREEDREWM